MILICFVKQRDLSQVFHLKGTREKEFEKHINKLFKDTTTEGLSENIHK